MGEGLATARPWDGRNDGLVASHVGNTRFILRIEKHGPAATLDDEDRACMGLVLRAVNAYDENQREIEQLRAALVGLLNAIPEIASTKMEKAVSLARAALTPRRTQ